MSASVLRFETEAGAHMLVVDGSRIYDLPADVDAELRTAIAAGETAIGALLARYGLDSPARIDDAPLSDPPLRSLSLAVAQTCNLACGYCYAQGGELRRAGQDAWNGRWRAMPCCGCLIRLRRASGSISHSSAASR